MSGSRRLILLTACRVPDVMFFLPARQVPDMQWLELYVRFPTSRHYLFGMIQMLMLNRLLFRWVT